MVLATRSVALALRGVHQSVVLDGTVGPDVLTQFPILGPNRSANQYPYQTTGVLQAWQNNANPYLVTPSTTNIFGLTSQALLCDVASDNSIFPDEGHRLAQTPVGELGEILGWILVGAHAQMAEPAAAIDRECEQRQ